MPSTNFDKQTGIMSFTTATNPFNESMVANISEVMWTKDITSSGENTTVDGVSTKIPASLIGNGSSTRGKNVTNVEGVTTLKGIVNSTTNTVTNSQSGGPSSVGLAVGVTVPVVIIVVAVVLILICVFRKRRFSKEKGQLNFELVYPDPQGLSSVNGSAFLTEMHGADVEDMDLQPTNIFMNQDILNKHDESFAAESEQTFNSQTNDTETVTAIPDKKSCDDSMDERDKVPNSEVGSITNEENRNLNKDSDDLSMEKKAFELSENTSNGYSLAKPVKCDDRENEPSMEVEEPSKDEGNDDGVYVAMGVEKDEIIVYGNSLDIQLSDNENSPDDMYTNVSVRRVQSMQATSTCQSEQEEHVQRRVVSETQGLTSRLPIAQPRLSKKKKFDPYDYLPGTQLRGKKQVHEEERSDGDDCADLRAEELYIDMSDTSHANEEDA